MSSQPDVLNQILSTVKSIDQKYQQLSATVGAVQEQVNRLGQDDKLQAPSSHVHTVNTNRNPLAGEEERRHEDHIELMGSQNASSESSLPLNPAPTHQVSEKKPRSLTTSRIILTTYPNQSGIDPIRMNWGNHDYQKRGPVVVSRDQHTIRRRNGTLPAMSLAVILM